MVVGTVVCTSPVVVAVNSTHRVVDAVPDEALEETVAWCANTLETTAALSVGGTGGPSAGGATGADGGVRVT
jgi:hypothetical protein